jgi:SAM-dependent methyltransferase
MVLLAIYNILLSKLSNREIIIVGTPVAGRRHADLEPIIGMFVNTLAIKNHPTGEKSFTQFLKEVKGKTLEAFDNQDYQFEDLVEMVGGERDRSRNPIFDVMFEMLNAELETGEFSKEIMGEHKEKHLYQNKMSKFDMTLVVVDTGKPLSFTVKFNTKLFKRETMERFIETFKQIMGKVIENNKIKLAEIDVLSELRRDELEARLSDDLEMDTSIEYNLYLADSQDGVDKLNKKFYERFNYPWFPGMLPSFEDSNFWITFLNQDIGDWKNSRIPPQPKIWVAGCGTNQAILTALKFPDAEILGTDISTKSIEICQNIAQQIGLKNLELREQSINKVRYKDTFDYIICTGVIHHNADPGIPLKNLSGALKKNGIMELMVYNYYHRIVTTAFQKAIRALCSKGSSIDMDMDIELPIAKAMIDNFFLQNYMGKFLAAKKGSPEVAIADSFLQPVEHSYTIESLDELAKCCNLQILTHCINQFDKKSGSLTWNINFNNKKIRDFYNPLPDIKRWQVSNLLMFEKSPMLWFYLQREDSENRRKTEKDICDTFLETSFKKVETSCKHYVLSPQKTYLLNPREFPCPAPPVPVDPVSKIVFDAVNSKSTMRAIFSNLNIETSFHTVNTIRLNLTTTAFPYLKAMT